MQIQKLKSSKLFYNKWPYKIECTIVGASRLSYLGAETCRLFCAGEIPDAIPHWIRNYKMSKTDRQQLLHFTNNAEPFLKLKDQLQIRTENKHFNFFCKDKVLLENIYNALEPWVINVYGPSNDEELNFMLDNGHKKILRDDLPKNGYQYKIYLKETLELDKRLDFLSWLEKFPDKVIISKTTKYWLTGGRKWSYSPFMYVKDEKMLMMIGLYTSHIKKIEEFIPRSNINTCLDQE